MLGNRAADQLDDSHRIAEDLDPRPSERAHVNPLQQEVAALLAAQARRTLRAVVLDHSVHLAGEPRCQQEVQSSLYAIGVEDAVLQFQGHDARKQHVSPRE